MLTKCKAFSSFHTPQPGLSPPPHPTSPSLQQATQAIPHRQRRHTLGRLRDLLFHNRWKGELGWSHGDRLGNRGLWALITGVNLRDLGPLNELSTRHQGEGVDPLYIESKRVHNNPFHLLKESMQVLGILCFSYIIYIYIYQSIGKETREGEKKQFAKLMLPWYGYTSNMNASLIMKKVGCKGPFSFWASARESTRSNAYYRFSFSVDHYNKVISIHLEYTK